MSTYYLTTPIYYVNDLPHIGHIYTTLVTDTVARYRRLAGDDVYFLTGTDEHGQKIQKAAAEKGIAPIELADRVVARYHELWAQLGMTHDDFIRTSQPRHIAGVQALIRRMMEKDDFYVARHEGWYCVRCETFYTEKELLSGNRCPVHETPCEWKSEENVFFRLSKYQDALLELYEKQPQFVRPASRLNEVRQFVAQGLKDLSVSRTTVDWGVPFPDQDGHTVYVWLDALINYITALGFGSDDTSLYDEYWQSGGPRIHLVGKDILRFHAVFWPAFLLSADLPLPHTVWAHGWWLRDEKKMSKSVGNVVRPDYLLEDFGTDSLRFYVLRDMVFGQDASFSDEAFIDRYNTDLANDLGNTLSRLVTLSRRAFADRLPPKPGDALRESAESAVAEYRKHMDEYAFQDALRSLWRLLQETNQYLVKNEPWKKMKDPNAADEVSAVLWTSLEALRLVATGLLPILPEKAPKVLLAIGAEVPESLDAGLAWGGLATGAELGAIEPLFPRIDKKAYLADADDAAAKAAKKGGKKEKKKVSDEKTAAAGDTAAEKKAEKPAAKADVDAVGSAPTEEERISIDQFFDVQLRVAEVKTAEPVPKSNKLLKLTVDVGEGEDRTLVAGIAKQYAPEDLVGRQVVIVANLKPAKLMGVESNGMVLAASEDGKPVLLAPESTVPVGTRVR